MERRHFLKSVGIFSAGLVAGEVVPVLKSNPIQQAILPSLDKNNWADFKFIDDAVMNDQFRSYLAQMAYGATDLGECLDTVARIIASEPLSWFSEWVATGNRIYESAVQYQKVNKSLSAASAFYRAAAYYRASLIHHAEQKNNPETIVIAQKAKSSFDLANELSKYPITSFEIPYEGTKLPAFFARSPIATKNAPILIFHQGRDAWPEDTKWIYNGAIQRGIHCLGVHAPGQGLAIRIQNLPFRHDWEKVITPVVDFASEIPGVDSKRIALMGLSMGGALVPRALAFENRIKIGVVNPGVLNWGESMFEKFSSIPGILSLYEKSPRYFDKAMSVLTQGWETADWWLKDSIWKHGVQTPHELFNELKKYNNEDVVDKISSTVLIMDGEGEEFSNGQAQKLFDALKGPKELMYFEKASTAHLHCQNGGLALASETLFNWLEEKL